MDLESHFATNVVTTSVEKWLLANFHYIRLVVADICGVSRSRLLPIKHAIEKLRKGLYAPAGIGIVPVDSTLPPSIVKPWVKEDHPNATWCAYINTIHAIPWADVQDEYLTERVRVAEVFCVVFTTDRRHSHLPAPCELCPRHIALRQLNRLEHEFGLTLKAAFEVEVTLMHKESREPLFSGHNIFLNLTDWHDILFYMEQNLTKAGVDIEGINGEYFPGQFEFVLAPADGLASADQMYITKQGMHEMCAKRGLLASFMSRLAEAAGTGLHFNFSLMDAVSGQNALHDPGSPNGLSDLARHWIAGMIKYTNSLCALFAPTVNCYRRFFCPFSPRDNSWGIDSRSAAYRVKVDSPTGAHIENRLPSGLSNPYLALAATLVAGMQGIKEKLECPPPRSTEASKLPASLSDALKMLEDDPVMTEALGDVFVHHLILTRRETDLVKFKDTDVSQMKQEDIQKEIEYYEKLL